MAVDSFGMMRGIRASDLPQVVRHVAHAILLRSGGERATCSAGVELLCLDTGLGERAVRDAIKALRASGLFRVRRRKGQTSLIEPQIGPLADLCQVDSSRAAERRAARDAATDLDSDSNSEPAPRAGTSGTTRRTQRHDAPEVPAPRADEIPSQIQTQSQNQPQPAEVAEAIASLVAFGMTRSKAQSIAPRMQPGDAAAAIAWCQAKGSGPGLIVWAVDRDDRPWLAQQHKPKANTPQFDIDAARVRLEARRAAESDPNHEMHQGKKK